MRIKSIIEKYQVFIAVILLFCIILICMACQGKQVINIEDMRDQYAEVKICYEKETNTPGSTANINKPVLEIEYDQDFVMCNGIKRADCYISETRTIVIPKKTHITTIWHAFCHSVIHEVEGDANPGGSHGHICFQKCGGARIIEGDIE